MVRQNRIGGIGVFPGIIFFAAIGLQQPKIHIKRCSMVLADTSFSFRRFDLSW